MVQIIEISYGSNFSAVLCCHGQNYSGGSCTRNCHWLQYLFKNVEHLEMSACRAVAMHERRQPCAGIEPVSVIGDATDLRGDGTGGPQGGRRPALPGRGAGIGSSTTSLDVPAFRRARLEWRQSRPQPQAVIWKVPPSAIFERSGLTKRPSLHRMRSSREAPH